MGKIITINLKWVQIIAGIQNQIFVDTEPLQHLEGHWFKSIRQFLHITNATVSIKGLWTPQLERQHDQCIMEVTRKCKETERINQVRLYLQATTLADITTADGTHLTEQAIGGTTMDLSTCNTRRSKHAWPRQPRPGPKTWRAWKTAIMTTLSIDGKSRQLRQPLGPWTINNKQSRQEWDWYMDTTTDIMYKRTTNRYTTHQWKEAKGYLYNEESKEIVSQVPITALPVSQNEYRVTKQPVKSYQDAPAITEPDSFNKYIDSLQDWERNLLRKTGNTRNVEDMVQSIIQSDTTYMVSNGGLVNGYGSFGWIIANKTELIKGRGEAEGFQELMQSFRAEGYGMLAALRYLWHAFKYSNITPATAPKTINCYCDNLGLIQRIG
jgi:hypothetical protein